MAQVELGASEPQVRAPLLGARTEQLVEILANTECPALTARRARRTERAGAPQDPIVWQEARGANVRDVDGNVYVDLTAGFGVALLGHRHQGVVDAIHSQTDRLLHALGDVYPSDVKIALLDRIAKLAPFPDARVILGTSGADAVEAALKTALLATKKPGVLAFVGSYHGLSQGPLATCGYSEAFRAPFQAHLHPHVTFAPFPRSDQDLRAALDEVERAITNARSEIGAVIIEPIQSRGGVVIPPKGFLSGVSELAKKHGALLIIDEIYTGLGRCGARWLCEEEGAVPDLLCLGKALGGGLPIGACAGKAEVMRAWGDPGGEAIHTGTFFGHPLSSAAALAALDALEKEDTAACAATLGDVFIKELKSAIAHHPRVRDVRGRGLLIGIEFDDGAYTLALMRRLLERGYITIPAGPRAELLSITPPASIDPSLLRGFIATLSACLT